MKTPDFLYHYTSLQVLALILESKTIKFNSLYNVDDMNEKISRDIINGGKYCFVSSWTDDPTESIPMWSMYTQLKGLRIGLPVVPFEQYHWKDPFTNELVESYLSLDYLYEKDIFPYLTDNILQKVIYTNEDNKLIPELKSYQENGFHVEYTKLGKYKKDIWSFQNEWRYILYVRPVRLSDYLSSIEHGKRKYAYNIKKSMDLHVDSLFLKISPQSLKKMEILCAPKMEKGDIILLNSLINKYCPDIKIKYSNIKLN